AEMLECKCRKNSVEDNIKLWNKMKSGEMDEGAAIIRFKGDMKHKNAVMRDPAMFRIIKKAHPMQGTKYSLWPMYDFESPVEDGLMKVTHRIRSKEFEMRTELQEKIQELLGFKKTIIEHQARFNLKDAIASKRKIREGIEKGELLGWDDPRLVTLAALRRRGFTPEGIRNFILRMGISKTEANVDWSMLEAENRKIIEPISKHYFFVANPVEIELKGVNKNIQIYKNPKDKELGLRELFIKEKVFISKEDFSQIKKGEKFRLKDFANLVLESKKPIKAKIVEETGLADKKIQWVGENAINVKLIMNDGSTVKGMAETQLEEEPEGAHVQLERIGFVRVDKKGKTLYFTHK
ncbi:MAG: glutamate--tRNA ligase, partial [Candidatus Diapherotrites archaeon]|nr:glutamate--tRNA ligase [Candidatus Diapherotrites archaeon]